MEFLLELLIWSIRRYGADSQQAFNLRGNKDNIYTINNIRTYVLHKYSWLRYIHNKSI